MSICIYYHPIPFRANFLAVLLADADVSYVIKHQELVELRNANPANQPIPFMAPPLLEDDDFYISQMPAAMLYLANKYNYNVADIQKSAMAMKITLDCADIADEITRSGGHMLMWDRDSWKDFRENRLKRWFEIIEETGKRYGLSSETYILGTKTPTFADMSIFASIGLMIRCLPPIEQDLNVNAPSIYALIERLGERENLRNFVKEQVEQFGDLYCGGQIEGSIRAMLDADNEQKETN